MSSAGRSTASNRRSWQAAGTATATDTPKAYQGLHKIVTKGLVPCFELTPDEGISDPSCRLLETPVDYISISRFPPGVASILRKRVTGSLGDQIDGRESRNDLGLTITPTDREDYRLFEITLDLYDNEDVQMVKVWHTNFDVANHPPVKVAAAGQPPAAPPPPPGAAPKGAQPQTQSATTSAEGSKLKEPVSTVRMHGLLAELPAQIEAYKSLDCEVLFKSAQISQIMICFFDEDEDKIFPCSVLNPPGNTIIHDCVEQHPPPDVPHDAPKQYFDPARLKLNRCPWLWPSGLTAPTILHREYNHRDMDCFSKAELHGTEMALMSIMKKGRQEWAEYNLVSGLEAYMLEEALHQNTTVPNADQVLSPTVESRIVHVIPDRLPHKFEDDSDASDKMFGDPHGIDERDLMEDRAAQAPKKRREKKGVEQTMAISTQDTQLAHMGRESLRSEFQELAASVAKERIEAEIEQDEDDFYSEALLDEED